MNISLKRCTIDNLLEYINDNGGEFGIEKTKFGEVPLQKYVANNIDEYLECSLSICIDKNKPIGIIFLRSLCKKTLELSIIIKEEYRNKNLLNFLLKTNCSFKNEHNCGFLNYLIKSINKTNIVTSVTKNSYLEKILLDLGFILVDKSISNNKVLYSLNN